MNEINEKKCIETLLDLGDIYSDSDAIIQSLRSLETVKEITEKEYDYIMDNGDEILEVKK